MSPLIDPPTITARDPISNLIATRPVLVAENLTLRAVAAVLAADKIGTALVERDDGTIGIVSERDVIRALADDADPDIVWSADVMTQDLITAHSDEPILRVAMRMIDEGIRHIGIVEKDDVTAVLSARDVFAVLAEDALANW